MRSVLLAISVCLLGAALQSRDGLFSPLAIALLAGSFSCALGATLARAALVDPWIEFAMLACLGAQLALLFTDFPGSHHESHSCREYLIFLILIACACVLVAEAIAFPRTRRTAFAGLLIVYLLAGGWLLHRTPAPYMDVFVFQREANRALHASQNPYAMEMPDLYGSAGPVVYAPNAARDGKLMFGFPYLPLSLAWNYFAELFAPDYRYLNLLTVAGAAVLIAVTGRSTISMLAGALLLFTPRGFFVIEQGWTEPLSVVLLIATIFCARRAPKLTPIAFGLLLASKQYCSLLILLTPLIAPPKQFWRFAGIEIATAIVVTLPAVLVDARAFFSSAVALQFHQPFREDSLSFPAMIAHLGGPRIGISLAVLFVMLIAGIAVTKVKANAGNFALAAFVMFFAFFAFNKQAFANYYFLVIAAGCCAIAASDRQSSPAQAG